MDQDALLSYSLAADGSIAFTLIDDGKNIIVIQNHTNLRRIELTLPAGVQVEDVSWSGSRIVFVASRQSVRTTETNWNEGLALNSTLFSIDQHGGGMKQEIPWGNFIGSIASMLKGTGSSCGRGIPMPCSPRVETFRGTLREPASCWHHGRRKPRDCPSPLNPVPCTPAAAPCAVPVPRGCLILVDEIPRTRFHVEANGIVRCEGPTRRIRLHP
jgi:hypothetical protein